MAVGGGSNMGGGRLVYLSPVGFYDSWTVREQPQLKVRVRSRSLDPINSIGWLLSITVGRISSC